MQTFSLIGIPNLLYSFNACQKCWNTCGKKIRMTGRSTTLLECCDNNLQNQHCFEGKGVLGLSLKQ